MNLGTRVVVQPACEPLTLAEAKLHLRVDDDDTAQDDVIEAIITAVREYGEMRTGRAFVQTTFETAFASFADYELELPRAKLLWVESVKYTDNDGNEQTVDPALYQVDTHSLVGRIKPVHLEAWPYDVRTTDFNPVRVRYAAGFTPGDGSPTTEALLRENIPKRVLQWMKIRIGDLFLHRESFVTGTIVSPMPHHHADGLLGAFKVNYFK
jgi:uncharacterized phiE125 gp8 family phage protein